MSDEIRKILREMTQQEPHTLLAEVVESDKAAGTCICMVGDVVELTDVKLRATEGSNGFLIVPADNSQVLISRVMGTDDFFVSMFSEVAEVMINGGENGGLINIEAHVSRMNAIEQDINSLKQIIADWVPTANDGGAGFKTAAATWAGQQLQETARGQLEDITITH